jgi:hypothetical protein
MVESLVARLLMFDVTVCQAGERLLCVYDLLKLALYCLEPALHPAVNEREPRDQD